MRTRKKLLLALVVIGMFLASAWPVMAEGPAPADARPPVQKFLGRVTAKDGTTFTLHTLDGDFTFQTNDRTRFHIPGVENATLDDVEIGDIAGVAAVKKPEGGLLALVVAVKPERVRLDGDVTQIAGNNLKIQNPGGEILVHTDENTRFRVPGVANPTLADIKVGDHIHGFAIKRGESLWGRLIAVVDEYTFRGQVTAIQDSAVTVKRPDGPITFNTDDHTRFRVPGVANPTLADVHVGDLVAVVAFGQEDGTILAKAVAALRGIKFQGVVTAKNGAVLTLSTEKGPVDVLTDDNTKFRVPGVENPTLDDVHVGDKVAVIAVSQGAGGGLLAKGIGVLPPEESL